MAYTKYSLTPANNNAAPPDGAPEGMLPSGVNDTMRDMMAQIRDCGDGIRGGTYTMTAPVITGGSITGVALSGNTLTNPVITGGSITNTSLSGNTITSPTITGGAISTSTLTGNTFTNPVISGGSINNTPIGATTASTGAFTTLSVSSTFTGYAAANIGYLNIPQNSQSAAYTLVLADAGKHIYHPSADTTARTWTIPANSSVAFPVGTAIAFVNDFSAGAITLSITSDTLVYTPDGTTGSRTIANGGVATCIKVASTRWIISGTKIS